MRLVIAFGQNLSTQYGAVLSEEKVRTLIRNYAFNSFGNQGFTMFMLFACLRLPDGLQGMILRELVSNYTTAFLSASEHPQIDSSFPFSESSGEITEVKA